MRTTICLTSKSFMKLPCVGYDSLKSVTVSAVNSSFELKFKFWWVGRELLLHCVNASNCPLELGEINDLAKTRASSMVVVL